MIRAASLGDSESSGRREHVKCNALPGCLGLVGSLGGEGGLGVFAPSGRISSGSFVLEAGP